MCHNPHCCQVPPVLEPLIPLKLHPLRHPSRISPQVYRPSRAGVPWNLFAGILHRTECEARKRTSTQRGRRMETAMKIRLHAINTLFAAAVLALAALMVGAPNARARK